MVDLDNIEFPYIIFFKDGHTYWKDGVKKIESVNGLLKYISDPFVDVYWSTHSVLKEAYGKEYSKHFGSFRSPRPQAEDLFGVFMDRMGADDFLAKKKELEERWLLKKTIAQWRGTMFHDYMENRVYQDGKLWNPAREKWFPVVKHEKTFDNQSLCRNLYDLPDGAYLELLVFDPEHDICGQADIVFIETIRKKRYVSVGDYKTNEEKPDTKSREKYLEPLSHLGKSKHMQYVLQINLYAKLLQRHGFIPTNLSYSWYENYDPGKEHRVDFNYMPDEMDLLFEYFL